MQSFDGERSHLLQIFQYLAVTHRQTLEDASCHRLVVLWHWLIRLLTIVLYCLHHARRVGKIWCIREDETLERLSLHAVLADLSHIGRGIRPLLPATLQDPHTADVLQETGRALDASLIREVIFKALFRDDGILCLDAEE